MSLCVSGLGPGPKRSWLVDIAAVQQLTGWGLVVAEQNMAFNKNHSLDKSPDSVFVLFGFFEINFGISGILLHWNEKKMTSLCSWSVKTHYH